MRPLCETILNWPLIILKLLFPINRILSSNVDSYSILVSVYVEKTKDALTSCFHSKVQYSTLHCDGTLILKTTVHCD